jgi:hypothetical protein
MSKKYTFSMVVVKPTGKGGKPLKPKEIKPKKKREGGMSNKSKDPKVKKIGIGTGKAKDYPGMKKIIEMNKKGKKRFSKGGEMLKGGQRKLDANKDGKISGEDFKLIRREKPEMKPIKRSMGSTSTEGNIKHGKLKSQKELKKITDSDEYKKSDYQTKNKMLNVATQSKGGEMKRGYGAARQTGMGLQDENLTPGKTMDYYKDLM